MTLKKIEVHTKNAPITPYDLENIEYEYINVAHIIAVSELRQVGDAKTKYAFLELTQKNYRFITESSWKDLVKNAQ